jgi:superfamily I DNA and RNA helicase
MFPPLFPFKLTGKELNHLKFLLFPEVRISLPKRDGEEIFGHEIKRLRMLDHHQEVLARKYDGGHRIIVGPSGSGKTLILVHKAALLKQYNPFIRKILFVCYNITLVNYIKRLLAEKGVGLGEGGVEVYHFFQLCSKILGEEVSYEAEDSEYYSLVAEETFSRLKEKDLKYDAILVDEGQDFSDDMYQVITSLLNLKTYSLTIALDDHQTLYRQSQAWKEMGIQAQGRVHRISCVYRNTSEIAGFADRFIGRKDGSAAPREKEQPDLFPDLYTFHGPCPEMKQFEGLEAMIGSVSDNIKEMIDSKECPASEVAILYAAKTPWNMPDKNLPEMIEKALDTKGVLYKWASEDYRSKKTYDITTNSVTLSTIHSVKGLDYYSVFLVGLDFIGPRIMALDHTKNLVYVGMTRARYRLFIPYINENELIRDLLNCI